MGRKVCPINVSPSCRKDLLNYCPPDSVTLSLEKVRKPSRHDPRVIACGIRGRATLAENADQVGLVRLVAASQAKQGRVHTTRGLANAIVFDNDGVLDWAGFSHEPDPYPAGNVSSVVEGLLSTNWLWPARQHVQGWQVKVSLHSLSGTLRGQSARPRFQFAVALHLHQRLHRVDRSLRNGVLGSARELYATSVAEVTSNRIPVEGTFAPSSLGIRLVK